MSEGPESIWGWAFGACTHMPASSPAAEWKIPAAFQGYRAYLPWEEGCGSAIYVRVFGDVAVAFGIQSPWGKEKRLKLIALKIRVQEAQRYCVTGFVH